MKKFDRQFAENVRYFSSTGLSMRKIAAKVGCSKSHVCKIVNYQSWKVSVNDKTS